ncbi:hypothetical protein [Streptomyces nigrescens]|uniref:Uncharacterized protein n=1 Tax=Streptomyces nigrescens TaxID=1920 RepID=A0ABY7I872_STRNI|nr:hypothetical protein [Streptomyces libani]WAT94916.1 hypothetical protein STRLI_000588 [Streptomyces libani subsp. libani]
MRTPVAFTSSFRRPTTIREAANNIRDVKASQLRLRQRGEFSAARDLDAEIEHQQAERQRLADEHNRDLDEIWGS